MIQAVQNASALNIYSLAPKRVVNPPSEPLQSFDREDKAIISAEAKLLNEVDKYNNGESDELNLALTCLTSKHEVEAEASVIKTKKEMLDTVIDIYKKSG